MPIQVDMVRCLLISPGDAQEDRGGVVRALERWNVSTGLRMNGYVLGLRWEVHARPELGAHPQTIINRQLVDQCQMGIAIFWARLGTPTDHHPSGSIEEIERLRSQNKPVLLYFCERPISQDKLDVGQWERLCTVKNEYFKQGIVGRYTSVSDLENQICHHITPYIEEILNRSQS